eukprot:UN25833
MIICGKKNFKVAPYGCHSQTSNLKLFQGGTLWVSLSNLKPEIISKKRNNTYS